MRHLGCASGNTMYAGSSSKQMSPYQCSVECRKNETQLQMISGSVVRSQDLVRNMSTDEFTIELWVYIQQNTTNATLAGSSTLLSYGKPGNSSLKLTLNRSIQVQLCDEKIDLGFMLPTYTWTHIAISWRSAAALDLFVNGTVVAAAKFSNGCRIMSNGYLEIGRGDIVSCYVPYFQY